MKKSILDQYNELLFEHDYPEINSLVDFFGVYIRVHSKEEYDYLERAKKSYISDIEYFYRSLFLILLKKNKKHDVVIRPCVEVSGTLSKNVCMI